MPETARYTICITEDADSDGVFAHFVWDPSTRGYGTTDLSAIFCLLLVEAEQKEVDLSEQAGDIVISQAVKNDSLEQALARHYGTTTPA